eukprot:CAMPEP_0198341912 /NCGR_PEP_ID=MMETSP1450-20131203/50230_1 /TAXON_ID=753684 ORGANISM="Madagascaria erythrocladiodes, Strain CCMP3234" /NCGR_SAMPLE_ID=MMETSP1450 /ASSEMBLY_ACC=CAM_ASM_001115 /LENGTH=170 /DNA_ID=CAMNT_0044046973 /DNA_START=71 /DNA_END=583 /DNA_ORIENTATION=-
MKSIIWGLVFVILCIELGVLAILCAPLPWGVRKTIARFLHNNGIAKKFKVSMYYLMVAISLAVVDAVMRIRALEGREETGDPDAAQGLGGTLNAQYLKGQRYRAQRNLYLAGFVLTLLFAIKRIIELVVNEIALRDEIKRISGKETTIGTAEVPAVTAVPDPSPEEKKKQ